MKRIILLLTIISHFAFGQSISTKYNSTTKKSYLQTGVVPKADVIEYSDTATGKSPYWKFLTGRIKFKNPIIATDTAGFDGVLVTKGDSLKLVSKSLIGGGSSAAIDTTKQYYIAQGRGSSPFLLYFNGTSWVKNDTSYIPRTGSDNITGNLKRLGSDFKIGLTSNNSFINFGDYSTQITTQGGASTASVQIGSGASSNVSLISGSGSTSFSVSSTSPTRLTGNYIDGDQVYRTDDSLRYIQLKDAQERFAPIGGGAVSSVFGRTGAVVADSGDYDISQITGGLSDTLADGKIWIGDGTNTAFPRTPSGDITMDNLGVFTIANNAVTTAKIADANVTNVKLANSTISGISLGNNLNDLTIGSGLSLNSGTTYNGGTARTLTNNLLTGVSGGQTLIGSTSTNSGINIRATSGVGTTGSNIAFQVGNNGATTAMTILPSGNVGIGTASPGNSLVVATGSGQYSSAVLILPSTHVSSRRASITLDDWIIIQDLSGNGTKDFSLYQGSSLASRLYVSNAGNIGINTNTPSERLSVSGNATVSGAFSVGGNAAVTGTLTSNNLFTMVAGVNFGYLYTPSNLTLTSAHTFVVSDAAVTITLPNVAGIAGRMYIIGNTSTGNTITISSSSQFTNVAGTPTSITLAAQTGKSVMVLATGGGWVVVSQ